MSGATEAVSAPPTPSRAAGTRWACGLAVLIATAALPLIGDLGNDLRVPLSYEEDGLLYLPVVKGVMETGTQWANPRLAAPDGFVLYDFPMPEAGHFLTLRALGLFTGDPVVTFNLFILMQFPLAALSATWVARRLGVGVLPAVLVGVLFSYVPHHTLLYHKHIFLSALYPVPLAILVCVRVIQGTAFLTRRPPTGQVKPPLLSARGFGGVVVCLLVGCTGAYFAFFTCGLLAAAGCIGAVSRRSLRPLVPAGAFVALVVAAGVASMLPALQYQREHGKNEVMKRRADEACVWSLRPAELLLPSRRHRIEALAWVGATYCEAFQDVSTTATAKFSSLGVAGAVGVLVCLFGLVRRDPTPEGESQRAVSLLMVFALLVAAPGGFGPLFNFAVSPWVRCYHRMSMLVQFFALVSLALAFTRWANPPAGRGRRWLVGLLVLGLIGFGLYDQTTTEVGPNFAERAAAFRADREYVRAVEASLPEGAAVFMLPYFIYPEHPGEEEMPQYGPSIAYIHSDTLRWSYGTMQGRPAADWPTRVSLWPVKEMVAELTARGFTAVWVDRWGYKGRVWDGEAELAAACPQPPVVSANGRYAVYQLPGAKP
jgi:hypothetical protein